MQAELERNLQQQLGDIQATGSQAAFQQAQQALANLRQRQMAAGQQMAGLGTAQQAAAMKELGALAGVGEQQRQQTQKALDLGFQQFREEQVYPESSLQQYQSIIRGFPISPTTTQTQQAILPQPSLSQQLIGGASALAGLGIAGQIPKLFEKGGPTNLKPVPEDNVGLSKLPQAVRNKMGFMSSGGSFPDLSGDGKITQKDILLGRGVINKKKGKRISKSDNKEYTEMLMALLEGKGRELTGMENMNDGGVVKMQSGQQPMNYMGGDVGGLSSFSLNPDPRDSLELRQKRDRAKYDPVRKVYYDPITNEVIPEIEMSREQPMKFSLGVPRSVPALKEGEVTRIRDEGSGINFKLPEFSQMPIVKGIASLGESGLETIGKGSQAFIKQASDILSPIGGIIKGGFTPRGEEELRLSQEELGQTLRTKGEELGEFGRRIVDTGKRAIDSIEDTLAKQQPGSFLQAQGLEEKLKRTKDEVSMLNNRISEAKSPTAKDELIKMRDNKIQEANSLATRYDSNVDSYEDLITKFELDRIKEKPISTPVTEKGKEEVVETKDETKPKERTDKEKYPFSGNTEKGVNQYIASEVADPKAAQSLSADMKKDPDSIKALSISDKYIDFMQKQKEESKAEFEKRKGFAIAQMGFAIMGGQRIVDAAAALMPNLSKIEQDRLERKNKQMLMQMEVDKLQLQEDKLKATERMAEKELGVKSQYYDALRESMVAKKMLKPEVIGALLPSEVTVGGETYEFDESAKQEIFKQSLDLYNANPELGISNAIGTATQGYLQASGQKPEKGLMDKIKSLFPGF